MLLHGDLYVCAVLVHVHPQEPALNPKTMAGVNWDVPRIYQQSVIGMIVRGITTLNPKPY